MTWNNRAFPSAIDVLVVSVAVGLVASLAAPWIELNGTFQSWRLVEWHTFWRGAGSFQLGDVVAATYRVPVEFATATMQATERNLATLAAALSVWHVTAFAVLLAAGTQARLRSGVSRRRLVIDAGAVVLVALLALGGLTVLLAMPSSRTLKVDFRTPSDVHTDSLVWSGLTVLPVAPVLALGAAGVQLVSGWRTWRSRP